MKLQLQTPADVAAHVSQGMKQRFGGMGRYMASDVVRSALVPLVVEACVALCAGHGEFPPIEDGAQLVRAVESIYESPDRKGMEIARLALQAITSARMIEALGASVEGSAWSTLAGFELRVRRGEASAWRFGEDGTVVFDPPALSA